MKTLLLLIALAAHAAAAVITVPAQHATVQAAVNAAQPGDTVSVSAGSYAENIATVRGGTAAAPITIQGDAGATVQRVTFKHAHIHVKGLAINGPAVEYGSHVIFGLNAHHSILSDFSIDTKSARHVYAISWSSGPTKPFDVTTAGDCVIRNGDITGVASSTALSMSGARNLVENNNIHDLRSADHVRLWGENSIIRGNKFLRNVAVPGLGNHVDFIQTFGNNGHGSRGHLIENNIIDGIVGGQLSQLEGNLVAEIGDWTLRNNIFANIDLQASCSIPGIRYLNNTFYRCNTVNGGHALVFGSRSYGGPNDTAKSYSGAIGVNRSHGSAAIGNVFYECSRPEKFAGWYSFGLELTDVSADYNFVSKTGNLPVRADNYSRPIGNPGGWDFQKFFEPHGINGGDPMLAPEFRPLPGSPLIGAGPNGGNIGATAASEEPVPETIRLLIQSRPPEGEWQTIHEHTTANEPSAEYRVIRDTDP